MQLHEPYVLALAADLRWRRHDGPKKRHARVAGDRAQPDGSCLRVL